MLQDALPKVLLAAADERSVAGNRRLIVAGPAHQPNLALARIRLVRRGDLHGSCPAAAQVPRADADFSRRSSLFSIRLRFPCRQSTANTVRHTPGWENWLSQRRNPCPGFDLLEVMSTSQTALLRASAWNRCAPGSPEGKQPLLPDLGSLVKTAAPGSSKSPSATACGSWRMTKKSDSRASSTSGATRNKVSSYSSSGWRAWAL